ncbi:sugar phosphate isomerase/epimerase family protein [Granulicella cerasi]|uniref:Sugar phosphate isomerase/epimerase family protein n=1 Tax=Granulicella cerasi TaxID=741063 RepID=A0ABW1ZAY7_9BACT|nr:sugar phosphate isomerase/epimerase family protein [Granulicella cerasi]
MLVGAGAALAATWLPEGNAQPASDHDSRSRIHISEITTKPWTLEQDVAAYKQQGLGIELWESKFDPAKIPQQLAWLEEQNISVSSLQPAVLTVFPSMSVLEPKDPAERVARMCRTIDLFGSVLKGKCFPTNTGADFTGNEYRVWRGSVDAYKRLADYAAERGVRVAFEPLGASLMNRSTTVFNMEQALELLHEVNHPNLGLTADAYNLWESNALEQVSLCGDKLFLVHIADWKRPRNFHDRRVPGEGQIPLADFLRRVHALHYRGPLVVELFSEGVPDSLWSQDMNDVVKRCKRGVEAALQQARA